MSARHLTSIRDLSRRDIDAIFAAAQRYKERYKRGIIDRDLMGKTVGLFFEKASTRTRLSIEAAVNALGGSCCFMDQTDQPLGKRENFHDFTHTISRYLEAAFLRTYVQSTVTEVARHASIPIINALSDHEHPCQALADLFTLQEKRGKLSGLRFAFVGDGNNMARSLALLCQLLEVDCVIASPKGYELADLKKESARMPRIHFSNDPREASRGADILYTDVWISMGDKNTPARRKAFQSFQINAALLQFAKPDALVMHCLPAHRGEEISDEALDGPHSIVFDQAENRTHVNKGVLKWILNL